MQWCSEWYDVNGTSKRNCNEANAFRKLTEFDDRMFHSEFLGNNTWNFKIKNDGYSFFAGQKLHIYFKE
jgi:hypothetical protein